MYRVWVWFSGYRVWVWFTGDAVWVWFAEEAVWVWFAGDAVWVWFAGETVWVWFARDTVWVWFAEETVWVWFAGETVWVWFAGDTVWVWFAGDAVWIWFAGDMVWVWFAEIQSVYFKTCWLCGDVLEYDYAKSFTLPKNYDAAKMTDLIYESWLLGFVECQNCFDKRKEPLKTTSDKMCSRKLQISEFIVEKKTFLIWFGDIIVNVMGQGGIYWISQKNFGKE